MHEVGSMGGVADVEPITIEMMESIQNFALNSSIDMNHLQGIAQQIYQKKYQIKKRKQLLQILILLPYVGMKMNPRTVAIIDQFAEYLATHPNTIKDLHRVRDHHIKRLLIDYGYRSLG